MRNINYVDICCGLAWGDEAKGKIVAELSKSKNYDYVCRWAGGNNAGHTICIGESKYKTHLIPSGVFFGIKSIIGPDCVVNVEAFFEELKYLRENGVNTELIKISPKANIVTSEHIKEDREKFANTLGTTSRGIAQCYRDKYARIGVLAKNIHSLKNYLWNEKLEGNILCEGAQGFWLDINQGNYPYITSSTTLPYGACSLGFPPHKIRRIYGAAKIYDTRSGIDPEFPESLLDEPDFIKIGKAGEEYGVTTGRKRKVNYLNLDKLIYAINVSGTSNLIISKVDILEVVGIFKYIYEEQVYAFNTKKEMIEKLSLILLKECSSIKELIFSESADKI